MPNWCSNRLSVTGDYGTIEDFLKFVKDENTDFSFDKVIPCPPELSAEGVHSYGSGETGDKWDKLRAENQEKFGFATAIDHHCCMWGTKWNLAEGEQWKVGIDNDGLHTKAFNDGLHTKAEMYFSTAWSPPIGVIEALSLKFTDLDFILNFFEGGVVFCGEMVWSDGDLVVDEQYDDYEKYPDRFKELAYEAGDTCWAEYIEEQEEEEEEEKFKAASEKALEESDAYNAGVKAGKEIQAKIKEAQDQSHDEIDKFLMGKMSKEEFLAKEKPSKPKPKPKPKITASKEDLKQYHKEFMP